MKYFSLRFWFYTKYVEGIFDNDYRYFCHKADKPYKLPNLSKHAALPIIKPTFVES